MKEIKRIDIPSVKYNYTKMKRVAAYARVSTKQELQASSLNLQIKHYAKEIIFNPNYIFCGIYADHGKSGTSMSKRDGFQKLLKKINAGKIDLVLVKSLSRFARNTVDALSVIKETRKLGVEFYFEKENLSSLDETIDMILTMMAAMAEAESESMSENIRWGFQKRAQKGKVPIRPIIGYDITEDKKYVINQKEANAIRHVFQLKLEGVSNLDIVKYLNQHGIKTTRGTAFTSTSQISNILRDEKYKGKMIYGKTYIKNSNKEKVSVKNNGERPMYIINNHHEPLIDILTFQKVQELMKTNVSMNRKSRLNNSKLKNFVYSLPHQSYLNNQPRQGNDKIFNLIDNSYYKNSHFPAAYARDLALVLKRATNALGRNFSDLEAKFNKHVNQSL